MRLEDLSPNSQDYLKTIWDLMEWTGQPAQLSDIVEKTGMKLSTVSGAVGRLTAQGLVAHTPYGAVELTEEGRSYALAMARRHRLLETFLVHTLGYRWDEVHDEADRLEHAVSDMMIDRIDAALGHPRRDPHGDPIPTADGQVDAPALLSLATARGGERVRVERVNDDDPELLAYLTSRGLAVGSALAIGEHMPYSHTVSFVVLDDSHDCGDCAASEGTRDEGASDDSSMIAPSSMIPSSGINDSDTHTGIIDERPLTHSQTTLPAMPPSATNTRTGIIDGQSQTQSSSTMNTHTGITQSNNDRGDTHAAANRQPIILDLSAADAIRVSHL